MKLSPRDFLLVISRRAEGANPESIIPDAHVFAVLRLIDIIAITDFRVRSLREPPGMTGSRELHEF